MTVMVYVHVRKRIVNVYEVEDLKIVCVKRDEVHVSV